MSALPVLREARQEDGVNPECRICRGAGVMGTKSPRMPEAPCVCMWPPDVMAYVLDVFRASLTADRERTKDWLASGQASRLLGMTPAAFRRACERGQMPGAERHLGWWRISREAAEKVLANRGARGEN